MARTILASVFPGISGSDHPRPLRAVLLASTLIAALPTAGLTQELPTGGSVASGSVSIGSSAPGSMQIQQGSDRAVVNWNSFSIGSGGAVNIRQPGTSSAILNRVTGDTTSQIHGSLTANGQVHIVNPNGILIGRNGQVRTGGGFVASTLDVSDDDFNRGRFSYRGNGASKGVTNLGSITVGSGGYAALIGGRVNNAGTIVAPLGRIGLGAGERVTLDLSGDGFLQVALPSEDDGDDSALIQNSGRVSADGGRIEMKAATARDAARNAINLSGVAEARSVSMQNGAIVLGGGSGGVVRVTGRVSVAAPRQPVRNPGLSSSSRPPRQTGGTIDITGQQIMLLGALLDASGDGGGGRVRIGGDFAGQGSLPHADSVSADAETRITADALTEGNGGRIVLWSDRRTGFVGNMSARGGSEGGKGGFVEVSSGGSVLYDGRTDLRAPKGSWGTLLIDPTDIFVPGTVSEDTIETALALGNYTLDTSAAGEGAGDIFIGDDSIGGGDISWTADTQFRLIANRDIVITSTISGANGRLSLEAGRDITLRGADLTTSGLTMDATTIFISGSSVTETGARGRVRTDNFIMSDGQWTQRGGTLSPFAAGNFNLTEAASFLRVRGGTGTATNPYLLTDVYGLQGMDSFVSRGEEVPPLLNSHFALANDITASGTAGWFSGFTDAAGFNPIGFDQGEGSDPFTGSLDGRGYRIIGLSVGSGNAEGGLFAYTDGATIRNLTLTGLQISASDVAGGLIALADDTTVSNVHTAGSVAMQGNDFYKTAGGLVGVMDGGRITLSSSAATVQITQSPGEGADVSAGGLAGEVYSGSVIDRSRATGNVTVTSSESGFFSGAIGGFVGYLSGTITDAYSSGDVSVVLSDGFGASAETSVGGFAGFHRIAGRDATMIRTAAHGDVTVTGGDFAVNVGGHTGTNIDGDIIDSYADGAVTSSSNMEQTVGGLVGFTSGGALTNTFSSGRVTTSGTGSRRVGGLIGGNGFAMPTTTVTASFFDRNRSGQAPNGLPGYGQAISTTTLQDTAAFLALAGSQGWNFSTVWAPGDRGVNPAIYTIDRVVFARPNNVTLQYGQAESTSTTGTTYGGPSAYVFAPTGDTLAVASVFDSLTFPSRNVGTGQFSLTTTSLTSARGESYRVVDLPATYRITPAPLTIRASDQSKAAGAGFTFTGGEFTTSRLFYTDRVGSVDLASLGAASGAGAGSYAISGSNAAGAGLSNYTITYVPGTMTVTPVAGPTGTPIPDGIPRPLDIPAFGLPNPQDTILVSDGPFASPDPASASVNATGAAVSQIILEARNSASSTLAEVNQMSSVLEIAAASCSQSDADVSRYLACLSDALDDFANKLDEISTDLPPGMENVAEIVRDARRNIDSARTRAERRLAGATTTAEREDIRRDAINEARGAIASASAQIREAITLVRADDPELARVHAATINRVAEAVDSVGIELARAVDL
ncbi:two-partner secretion domain-containing protein [Paracoccus zhejiangensis]|uniref:Filamentous haemagglutinin FhaB/tRNA nuclease CdiA-like TPS domain-containing protein n=1 Tax=Paracoccus zhejiangensis TaxID=1077935 RepID=A0A2H5F4S0_9RHOB|nr:filamentous hemagglutinin N-terminal domain-containing protein [Paracoccus zhejiangensis]AUH66540.1 hypothetical protein CX676_19725 [Paracoccus zhejiangensis]